MAPVKLDSPVKAFAAFVGMVLLGQAAIKVFKDKFTIISSVILVKGRGTASNLIRHL